IVFNSIRNDTGAAMKKYFLSFLSLIFSVSILVPGYIGAQSYQSFEKEFNRIIDETRWQAGPFRIFPRILFSNIGIDNNVYYQSDENEPIKDFTLTTSLSLTTHLLVRQRMIFSFTYIPQYVFYAHEERERSFNNSFLPAFKVLLFNRFVLSGSYFYQKHRIRATSEFDFRTEEVRKETRGQLFYETGRRMTFGFSGLIRELRYEDVEQPGQEIRYSRFLNRTEKVGQAELYYQIFSDSFFFVTAGLSNIEFTHPESKWKDSYIYQIYPGIQFPIFGKIRGTLSVGYKVLDPYRAKRKGFSGFVGNTRLEYQLRRFRFRALYERDCEFSYWTDNVFYIQDRYGAGISFYMNQYIRLDYDFNYSDAFYPEAERLRLPDESYVEVNRNDKYTTHSVGVVIRVFRNTGIGLIATYWERQSNFRVRDRNRLFIGGYLTYDF
ncbi:MAG: outer membrane beta-barrel protein, partial [Candidatus Aminicenantes bacterium]|nr:outer membrane beta-barrel protein [Candidatus Aminicenantes bacterium]